MSRRSAVLAGLWFPASLALLLAACDDGPVGTDPRQGPDMSPGHGYLRVSASMTGVFPSRTATATIDDTLILPLQGFNEDQPSRGNARVRLTTGFHRVRLTGVEPNCDDDLSAEVWVSSTEERDLVFRVSCRGTGRVTGRSMAWISEGDWGNELSLMSPEGDVSTTGGYAWSPTDMAWSGDGSMLAVLQGPTSVVVLDGDADRMVREWSTLVHGVSVAWVPGQDALSVLEPFPTGCNVRVLEAPWTPASFRLIPCGSAAPGDTRGDVAWSPDGRTVAVGLRGDGNLRLVDVTTGHLDIAPIPRAGFAPIALAWIPGGASLYVLTMCTGGCTPARLVLWQYSLNERSWDDLRSWNTAADATDLATLELFGTDHLAVGPVNRSVLLVPLVGDAHSRTLLGEYDHRVTRRP